MKTSGSIYRVIVKPDMVGQSVLIPGDQVAIKAVNKIPAGEEMYCSIESVSTIKHWRYSLNGLFHAGCQFVADNTEDPGWDTLEKTKRRVKLALHFFEDDPIVHITPDGNKFVYFELRSMAFHKLDNDEASELSDRAFKVMADKVEMEEEEFIEAVKSAMQGEI